MHFLNVYRATLSRVWLCYGQSSVRQSVALPYSDHIVWNFFESNYKKTSLWTLLPSYKEASIYSKGSS